MVARGRQTHQDSQKHLRVPSHSQGCLQPARLHHKEKEERISPQRWKLLQKAWLRYRLEPERSLLKPNHQEGDALYRACQPRKWRLRHRDTHLSNRRLGYFCLASRATRLVHNRDWVSQGRSPSAGVPERLRDNGQPPQNHEQKNGVAEPCKYNLELTSNQTYLM